MNKTSAIQKFWAAVVLAIPAICQADNTIWLSDNVAWTSTASAVRNMGFDVRDVSQIEGNSGLVLRVVAVTNDLTTPMGTPFGGHATAADIFYRCVIGGGFVSLTSGIHVGAYTFTGRTASQVTNNMVTAHVDTAVKALQQNVNDIQALVDDCNALRRMVANGSGSQKAAAKSKK